MVWTPHRRQMFPIVNQWGKSNSPMTQAFILCTARAAMTGLPFCRRGVPAFDQGWVMIERYREVDETT